MNREQVKAEFGKELFECRNSMAKKGKPAGQKVVGKMVGVTGTTISSWERGYLFPTRENFEALVAVFPVLNKDRYRDAILVDWVNDTGPYNPNPSRAPRTRAAAKPNRVVNMAGTTKRKTGAQKQWDTPLTFKGRLQSGKFKSRSGAHRVLTKAVAKNIKNSWSDEEHRAAIALINAHFLGQESRSTVAAASSEQLDGETFELRLLEGAYRTAKEARRVLGRMHGLKGEVEYLQQEVDRYFGVSKTEEPVVQEQATQPPVVAIMAPPRTEVIEVHGILIEAFRDPTGNGYWAQLSTICDPIGVETKGQRIKLQERSWAKGKVEQISTLHPDGSPRAGQAPWYIHSSIIGMLLAIMHEKNVPEGPIRDALIKLQLQLCDVLDEHFHRKSQPSLDQQFANVAEALLSTAKAIAKGNMRLSLVEDQLVIIKNALLGQPSVEPSAAPSSPPPWTCDAEGTWRETVSGLTYLEEGKIAYALSTSSGVPLEKFTSEVLGKLCRKARYQAFPVKVEDKVLWPDALRPSSPVFNSVLAQVRLWAMLAYPDFTDNGGGLPQFDDHSSLRNLIATYGRVQGIKRFSEASREDAYTS